MRNHLSDFYIVNLLTGKRINLPPVESQSGSTTLKRTVDNKFHTKIMCGFRFHEADSRGFKIRSPGLWVEDEEASDFFVIFTFIMDGFLPYTSYAIFCRNGDEFWRHFSDESPCTHMVYKNHKLYAFLYQKIQIFDFSGELLVKAPETDDEYVASFSFPRPSFDFGYYGDFKKKSIVVTISGHVLIVVWVLTSHRTLLFKIYKMSSRTNKWERIVSLDGEAMLLDLGVTMPAKDIKGIN